MSIIISETKDGFNIHDYGWGNVTPTTSDRNSNQKCQHLIKNIIVVSLLFWLAGFLIKHNIKHNIKLK